MNTIFLTIAIVMFGFALLVWKAPPVRLFVMACGFLAYAKITDLFRRD